jgi:hypothetical protein
MHSFLSKLASGIRTFGFFFWFALTLFLLVAALYLWQPDGAFALTIYSPWAPGTLGFFVTILVCLIKRSKPLFFLALAWLVWGLAASDEVHALVRRTPDDGEMNSFRYDGKRLRIISLNCAGGSIGAAREVQAWGPDIVLLQESPSKRELEPLAKELFGPKAGIAVGPDASILSRYPLEDWFAKKRPPANFTGAFFRISENERWILVSLRLQPPVLRFDLWNPECWKAFAEDRIRRRKELHKLLEAVNTYDDLEPMIVGGDFNAPPDRSITSLMKQRGGFPDYPLVDTARIAGSGWTMTSISAFPLVRIDQIWTDRGFEPIRTIAVPTKHSDHRMVVADVRIRK